MRLMGKEVADALGERLRGRVQALKEKEIHPALALIRVGENPADGSYERGVRNRAEALGVKVITMALRSTVSREEMLAVMDQVNADDTIHGVLLFRPLPPRLKAHEWEICNRLLPRKDVDGMTALSAAGVYTGAPLGFPPCTAEACMEMLHHYGIDPAGKRAVVLGRSLVIGRPVAMLLMQRNATVSILHTGTENPKESVRNGDILICAAGRKDFITSDWVRPGQVILDVSMNYDPEKITPKGKGGMVGDCDFAAVEPIVDAITPVPGGVGAVTNTVLLHHVIQAAESL